MPKAKPLTDAMIKPANAALLKGVSRRDIFDGHTKGLLLRVTADKKGWWLSYTAPDAKAGSRTRFPLGEYPHMCLEDARDAAREKKRMVAAGVDPRAAEKAAAEAAMAAEVAADPESPLNYTVAKLLEVWNQRVLSPAPAIINAPVAAELVPAKGRRKKKRILKPLRTAVEIVRRMNKDVIPILGNMKVKDFEVAHIHLVLDRIADRECYTLANRVFADVKRMLKYGVQRGCMKFNPLAEIEPLYEEQSCNRYLSLDEIVHFWRIVPQALIRSPKVQLILKVMLATSKRSNEICGAKRSEINWLKREWIIPACRVKGQENTVTDEIVPLSDLAYKLLQQAAQSSNSEYLFPDDDNDGPFKPGVVSKAVKLALEPTEEMPLGRFGMAKWTPHDLRRTVGTQVLNEDNNLGIDRFIKYLMLNHRSEIKGNVSDEVYDQNKYTGKKRHGMVTWGDFLARLVGEECEHREAA